MAMKGIVIHEFDVVVSSTSYAMGASGVYPIPNTVFDWLEQQALRISEMEGVAWLRLTQRNGQRAVQLQSYVGVIRAPDGYQIEVLPKIGKATSEEEARQLLLEMLCCLENFRHIQTDRATVLARKMPLLEVFISEFLHAVKSVVRRGIRSDYHTQEENLFILRGKIRMSTHLQKNAYRRDRFFAEYDDFSPNRPENRLLHAALKCVTAWTHSQNNQQLARELSFAFSDIQASKSPSSDFAKVRLDRGMTYYEEGIAWARLILSDNSPLTGGGLNSAPSLLFPMEAVYEAFVGKHLSCQLSSAYKLKKQVSSICLVRHIEQDWFRLKPDMLIKLADKNFMVLDTKWKLIDQNKNNSSNKYGLSQSDFYQLHVYGQSYLNGEGDVVLIYPRTEHFNKPFPVFIFSHSPGLRLWVLPFSLKEKCLILPSSEELVSAPFLF